MGSHSVWQYLAPADRETFISGTICWLMDPEGDHPLGNQLLSLLLKKLKLSTKINSKLTVKPEVTEGRDKRFDISVYENGEQIAIFEVKCKTFGSREQIKKYSKKLGRIAFGEWNFPDLNEDDRTDYPLITFAHLAEEILRQPSAQANSFVCSFAKHLRKEAEFFQKLRGFFIEETEVEPPQLPTIHRFSDRFCNQLFWHWFKEQSCKDSLLTEWTTKSEQSGVWLASEEIIIEESLLLPELNLNLSGSFSYWMHIELTNETGGILGEKGEEVGKIEVRIYKDTNCRQDLFHQIKNADIGCEFQSRNSRPASNYDYWYALRRPLKLEDFRFSKLHALIELLKQ